MTTTPATDLVVQAAASTLVTLFDARVRAHPTRIAVEDGLRRITYRELEERSRRLATRLAGLGVGRGQRVGLLSENRAEYFEVILAASRLGAIVACQSTRSTPRELTACLDLVEPEVTIASPRQYELHGATLATRSEDFIVLGPGYEEILSTSAPWEQPSAAEPEDIVVIIYTSGTTGMPKGACISHRAEIARSMATRAELGLAGGDTFVAWSPLSHMGALDNSLSTLISGGKVIVVDGFDTTRLVTVVATERLGWLLVMPGTVGRLADALRQSGTVPAGIRLCGVMPDLVRPAEIADLTTLLDAPFANTFGSTETGCPPCSANVIPVGVIPSDFPKEQSAYCEIRLVDPAGRDVPDGVPGELCMRGPTLFSGYWNNPETNAADFRDGWFHMGDVLVRRADGLLAFVDRVKYMIKSGGENVYPAEIERVLLQDPRVLEAGVVRRSDPVWGEVPVAFVVRSEDTVSVDHLLDTCRRNLPGHKMPKEIHFIPSESVPRSSSGKVLRHELEKLLVEP
jgi:acyl-CoA synthetase (AMP-forming)/AMP-acid ligase II